MHLPQIAGFQKLDTANEARPEARFPDIQLPQKPTKRPDRKFSSFAAVMGALLFGSCVAGYFFFSSWLENNFMNEINFEIVPYTELNQVEKIIDPELGGQALKEARACNVPMLFAIVKSAPGHFVQTFRIRSGSYLTPPIVVTEAPQRVPLPAPGPFSLGYGTIGLEGQFDGVQIWRVNQVWGEALNSAINKSLGVHWSSGPAC